MGYCYHNIQKDYPVYSKINNIVPEVQEQKKKIKQDYESVKNQVMEANKITVNVQETKKTKKYNIN